MPSSLRVSLLVLLSILALAQTPHVPSAEPDDPPDTRLPSGRSQKSEILKADHAKNIEEARELNRMTEELKNELEKNTEYVFSIATLKKVEEIEKTARRIRSRLKRY